MTHPAIAQSFEALSLVCDGASSRDDRGFNGSDAKWGKRLAARLRVGYRLTKAEHREALQRLQKYQGQLAGSAVALPDTLRLELWLEDYNEPAGHPETTEDYFEVEGDRLIARFAYDPAKVRAIKSVDGARWNGEFWSVGWHKAEEAIAVLEDLRITPTVQAQLDEWAARPLPQPEPIGRVQLMGNALIVSFKYDPAKVAAIKAIKGARFNGEGKFWQLPLSSAEHVAATFPMFEFDEAIAQKVQSAQAEALAEQAASQSALQRLLEAASVDEPLPNGRILYQHQKDAVKWAIAQIQTTDLRGVILALDMGLGKTITSLVVARAYQQFFNIPVLVVCPASLKENWQREAAMVELPVEIFSWAKMPAPLETQEYVVICDESHFAQAGSKSKRGQAFIDLASDANCKASLLLTGTPIKNGRPVNLFPLLKASGHELAHDKRGYEARFCAAKATRFCQWDVTGAAHLDELHLKTKDVLLRRTKAECLDLPQKTRMMREAEVTGDRLKNWKTAYREAQEEYEANKGMGNGEALVLLTKLRKAASHAKVETTIALAEEVLEQGQQVVIFTEFLESAKALHQAIGGGLLIGETPVEERQGLVDRFQSGQSKVFISTSRAGGVGITLTASQTVIMMDRPWTPGDAMQCEDRCHRIGQQSAVTAIWLQWSEIDFKVDAVLEQKQERIDLVLQGKRKTLRGIRSPFDIAKELAEDVLG